MKLLMFHAKEFWFRPFKKTLEGAESATEEKNFDEGIVVFLQAEKEDEDRKEDVVKKAIDNIKWLSNKLGTTRVVLHPFAHLSQSKSSPEFAQGVLEEMLNKLALKNLSVGITPYGYMHEFRIHVHGESLAKVFKEI